MTNGTPTTRLAKPVLAYDFFRFLRRPLPGLASDHARDVREVAQAAKRTGEKPSTLRRLEYRYNMENIARAYPLPSMEYER